MKNQFKHEIEALEAKRAFDLTNKEIADDKDFKQILALLLGIGIVFCVFVLYVLIKL